MKCRSATPRRASPPCASAAAWASRCALHATNRAGLRDEKIICQLRSVLIKRKCPVSRRAFFIWIAFSSEVDTCSREENASNLRIDGVNRPEYFRLIKNHQGVFDMARVALVTGGTRGIGAAISKALKAAGYK